MGNLHMKIKQSNGANNLLYVFLIVGILLMCAGIGIAIYYGIDSQNYAKVSATITNIEVSKDSDGDNNYYVTVDYEYNGVQYHDIYTGYWERGMYEGQTITIYCNKDHPTDIRSSTLMIILPCVLFGMGLIFTLVVSFPIHKMLKQKRWAKMALEHGEKIICRITAVHPDSSYRVNGRIVNNIIECVPIDQNKIATFSSAPYNRKYYVEIGSTINVYIDRDNQLNQYVDLNSIEAPNPLINDADYPTNYENTGKEDSLEMVQTAKDDKV